jgi:hypothetical protein
MSQCHFSNHKSHVGHPGVEPGPPHDGRPATNRLSHGTALAVVTTSSVRGAEGIQVTCARIQMDSPLSQTFVYISICMQTDLMKRRALSTHLIEINV